VRVGEQAAGAEGRGQPEQRTAHRRPRYVSRNRRRGPIGTVVRLSH
jgi:hypothetical protein